ncbi:MAG: hypothetical protein CMH63_03600 [Nanoarchaeota archaeon]|jgi:hypothetical protein|nr:hypothetical protein [Nanoarchaeota archaeon]|tara:strand:+ start:6167 stop:6406 length:240 start_codon:yes stop_codon:yes gene_type:complete
MGIKDLLRKGSGLDLVTDNEEGKEEKPSGVGKEVKKAKVSSSSMTKTDSRMLKQLESDLSRAIEKLEDARDKLRVRRGY